MGKTGFSHSEGAGGALLSEGISTYPETEALTRGEDASNVTGNLVG